MHRRRGSQGENLRMRTRITVSFPTITGARQFDARIVKHDGPNRNVVGTRLRRRVEGSRDKRV